MLVGNFNCSEIVRETYESGGENTWENRLFKLTEEYSDTIAAFLSSTALKIVFGKPKLIPPGAGGYEDSSKPRRLGFEDCSGGVLGDGFQLANRILLKNNNKKEIWRPIESK